VGIAAPVPGVSDDGESPAAPPASLTLAPLIELLTRGEFDLVALGRAVLADPYWGAKVADGRLAEIRLYDKSADDCLF
jgi:2,4-dienoyl-CoA reductase-like NADH-dependent reductase (Old Yellow Enzyme family)